MRPHVLIHDNVVHHVAESELARAGPLTQSLTGPLQHASGRRDVEPRPANDDFLVESCTGELRLLTADPLIPFEHFATRAPGVPLLRHDPRRPRKTQPGPLTDGTVASQIDSSELKRAATAVAATSPLWRLAINCDRFGQRAQAMGASNEPHTPIQTPPAPNLFPCSWTDHGRGPPDRRGSMRMRTPSLSQK